MTKRFGFTYIHCSDLPAMKHFYGGILGLELIWESETMLGFRIGDHQLSISFAPELPAPAAEFAIQPGWQGGTAARSSWSIECDSEAFGMIVAAAKAAGARSWQTDPVWVGYWSYPLLDPMNNTVEIACAEEAGYKG